MKKFSWLLVLMLTLSFVLAACGGDSGGDGGEEAPEDETTEEDASSGDSASGEDWIENITVLTGGEAGVYFPIGVSMADIIDSQL